MWYGLKKSEIAELEALNKMLLRKILDTPISTPTEALQLELGVMSISTIIKARRINFLHYLVRRNEKEMIYKFFKTQWDYPVKDDWTTQVRQDLRDFEMSDNLDFIKSKSKYCFKNLVKEKAKKYELARLLEVKSTHSKMANLKYHSLEIQEYLKLDICNSTQAKTMFRFRCRMENFSENFRGIQGPQPCPLCGVHLDSQEKSFTCQKITQVIDIASDYTEIFNTNIPPTLFKVIEKITQLREDSSNM